MEFEKVGGCVCDKKPGGEPRSLVVLTRRQIRLIHVRAYVHFSMHTETMASRQTTFFFLYYLYIYSFVLFILVSFPM